ncbi:STAS domain-containing protein [Hymenobacter sp. HSC-4F20]|uniref:STAS domain-containing protein n=1 Tax=Hymenobacter sp. HSC-4F20 TaxID=2864135 RepID=UPI001C7369D6|nr:STAS domain-containing protein [Hymenobacter sp. HSC-4F20]MBX0289215.1 STAS domain-containing protein [Hymenobacter sp. HSC-4F20]
MRHVPVTSAPEPVVFSIDLNTTDPVALAHQLVRTQPGSRPRLLIDCQHLQCLRTLGVSHLVSQLLLARQAGAHVLLSNVGPALQRALCLLRLDEVFELQPMGSNAGPYLT